MKICLLFLLLSMPCLAKYDDCRNLEIMKLGQIPSIKFDQKSIFLKIIADTSVDEFNLIMPCESWSISKDSSICDQKKQHTFNQKGNFILSNNHYNLGACFCSSCSNAARIMDELHTPYYVSGSNCKGNAKLSIKEKQDESLPRWYENPMAKGSSFNLTDLIFYPNKAMFVKTSYQELDHLFTLLKGQPDLEIVIQGHVNGPKQKNSATFQKLSENRAKAVKKYLLRKGIKKSRMTHQGFGNTKMLCKKPKNNLEMKKNRRVEILIK